jgi:hypothetical protein
VPTTPRSENSLPVTSKRRTIARVVHRMNLRQLEIEGRSKGSCSLPPPTSRTTHWPELKPTSQLLNKMWHSTTPGSPLTLLSRLQCWIPNPLRRCCLPLAASSCDLFSCFMIKKGPECRYFIRHSALPAIL